MSTSKDPVGAAAAAANQNSAQPCGCDPGAGYVCAWHIAMGSGGTSSVSIHIPDPAPVTLKGIGGAPTRAAVLPTDAAGRKQHPVASGVLDYFPDALAVIANVSWRGNEQHNPGTPLHWDRSKSGDEADTLIRHFLQRGTVDTDGIRHSAKMAWRALALLQKEIEGEA